MLDSPVVQQAFAAIMTAIASAIVLAASYYWGPNRRDVRRKRKSDQAADDQWVRDSREVEEADD